MNKSALRTRFPRRSRDTFYNAQEKKVVLTVPAVKLHCQKIELAEEAA